MARYHVSNRFASQSSITTTFKTQVVLTAVTATLCRGRTVRISVGADSNAYAATDCQILWSVQRCTTAGTATAATPNPAVPGDVASRSAAGINATVEPTGAAITTELWGFALNQRASYSWVAQDQDAMLQWPATNANGLAALALSPGYANNVAYHIDYEDQ
jgi:hypothetical protein